MSCYILQLSLRFTCGYELTCYCKPLPRAVNCTLMQIWSRSVMIMISAVIALSHHSLFGYWNVLRNASINTKQNERNSNRRRSLCSSCFPQDVALMVWTCRTPTASITQLNSAKDAFLFSHRPRRSTGAFVSHSTVASDRRGFSKDKYSL